MTSWTKSSYSDNMHCVEVWRKSSRSSGNGSCVEVAFHKASLDNGTCVEVGRCDCDTPEVLVRDSKDPDGPRLSVTPAAFDAFLAGVRAGQFDHTG